MKKIIKKYLFTLKIKIILKNFTRLLLIYLTSFGILSFTIITYAKFFEFTNLFSTIVLCIKLTLIAFFVHFLWTFPRLHQLVKIADELYFKERLITAIEFEDTINETANLQRKDTLSTMKKIKIETLYHIKIDKRLALALIIIIGLNIGISYLQTDIGISNLIAAEDQKEVENKLELLKKNIENDILESKLNKETIDEILRGLEKNLEDIENKEDALKALALTKNELTEKLDENELKEMESALQEIDKTAKELAGESLSDYAFNEIEHELNEELASQNANENPDAFNENMEANQNSNGGQSANQSEASETNQASNNDEANKNTEAGENIETTEITHTAECDGSDNGTWQNQANGTVSAKELGEAKLSENGTNMQAMQGTQGMNGMQGNGMGSMPGGKGRGLSSPDNVDILNPERLTGQKNTQFVPSQKSSEGDDDSYSKAKNMPKEAGEFINYKEIIAEYKNKASYTSKELDIPNGMRNVVKDYFDSIQE